MLWHGRSLSFKQDDEPPLAGGLGCLLLLDLCHKQFFIKKCVLVKDLQIVELTLHPLVKTKQMWKFGLPDVLAVGRTSR